MENQDTSILATQSQITSLVSSVVTLNHHKTSFDRCIICDNYRYECLVPEKICLYCAENKNIVDLINLHNLINAQRSDKKAIRYRTPVTCYLKNSHQKVRDYESANEAADIHGIPRSSVFRSADCKNPLSRGVSSKALQCKIYFRYTK